MAASRAKTSPPSSPAGEVYDEPFSEDDLCGYGCHAEGVPPGDIHSVGCEHGRYQVTEKTKRKAAPANEARPETVHDRDVHFPTEQPAPAPSAEGMKLLIDRSNNHDGRILKLEATVQALLAEREAAAESEPETATGE